MPSVVHPNKRRRPPVEPSKEIGTRAQTIMGPAREISETSQRANPRFVPTPLVVRPAQLISVDLGEPVGGVHVERTLRPVGLCGRCKLFEGECECAPVDVPRVTVKKSRKSAKKKKSTKRR